MRITLAAFAAAGMWTVARGGIIALYRIALEHVEYSGEALRFSCRKSISTGVRLGSRQRTR